MKESIRLLTRTTWIVTLILLFSTYGCQKENSTSKEAIDLARKEIDAAWLSEDADVIMANSADDMILMPPNMERKTGKEEIRSFLQGFFDHFTMTELKITEREVIVSGDWAFERSSYEWVIVPEGGGEGISDQVNFIGIWQRQSDGAWREVRAIWNSTKPIAGTQ
jgi:ketosteroid isomerase-like protein